MVQTQDFVNVFGAFLAGHRNGSIRLLITTAGGWARTSLPQHPWPEFFLQLTGTT